MKRQSVLLIGTFLLLTVLLTADAVRASWVQRFDRNLYNDEGKAIAVDQAGNVYVTGYASKWTFLDGLRPNYVTIKYDTAGSRQWCQYYNGPGSKGDCATAIAVDEAGNVYVTGYSHRDGSGYDYATIKYNTAGDQLWVRRYNGTANSRDTALAIAVDKAGNVYVTGTSAGTFKEPYYITIKYDANGNRQWLMGELGTAEGMAVDEGGNVYVTAVSQGDYTTVKYAINGNQQWTATYDGPSKLYDAPLAIGLDGAGNVYVTGYSRGKGLDNYTTIKYDNDGQFLWLRRLPAGDMNSYPSAMVVTGAGGVYVTGYAYYSGHAYYRTVKYDTDSHPKWVKNYGDQDIMHYYAKAIAVDKWGNCYVTGFGGAGVAGVDNYATVKYDASGNEKWVKIYQGPMNVDRANAIAVDQRGNVYVTGSSKGVDSQLDIATIKYGNY
jgi:hypothetical protein